MLISALCLGLLWISFPMPPHGGCYGHGLDSALQRCRPEEEQETVGSLKWCLGLSHAPQDPPHSAWFAVRACVCTTSHQGARGAGVGGVQLTVEVGENFSEGIHCPLTESTA